MAVSQTGSEQDEAEVSAKLISPAALGVVVLLLVDYLNGRTFTTNLTLIIGLAAFSTVFAISHFVPEFKFEKAHAFYLYVYHWLLSFILIFVVPTPSYYLYLWVLLMYLSEFYYQARGMALSASALLVVMLMGSLYQNNGLNKDSLVRILCEFIIIMTVNHIMTRLAFGNRKKRAEVYEKILQAEVEHDRLMALINSMSDGVIATDEQGKIINYNATALDLLDTNATLTGKNISEFLKLIDSNEKPVHIMEIAEQTNYLQRRSDLSMKYGENDKISLDINISRIARSTVLSQQQGYTFLLRDITQQKSLDEEKDLFISEVSHELRTPITIAEGEMSMAAYLAEKPEANIDEVKESVIKAHDQVIFLADMVNDLSALSRAQRNDKGMDIETFSVGDVLKKLEETYRPQAEKKGLYMKIDLAPNVPPLTTSRLYFREIMQNFITNAIKYTQEGGVTIKGQAVDKNTLLIGVSDTGAGITKSEQAKVYQKFWRSDDALTRSTGGTGLGLFITSKLAQRIGAELRLQSKLNEGSTFSIMLPVQAFKPVDQRNAAKTEVANIF